jgi:hypothetical protein
MRLPNITVTPAVLFLLLSLFFVTSSFRYNTTNDSYKIFIVQDGIKSEIAYNSTVVKLKKKPFKIELYLINKLEGVFVNASLQKDYYDTPLTKAFKNWKDIDALTVSEQEDNESKVLLTSPLYVCYWYYENDKPYRVDPGIKHENNAVILTKSIENILELESEKNHPVAEMSQPLYLVTFYKKYDDKKSIDLERKRVKIIFE